MAKAEKKKLTGRKRDERVAAYIFVAPAVIPYTFQDLNIRS